MNLEGRSYKVIGLMSGTSLDGVDLAYCNFLLSEKDQWSYRFIAAETIKYPEFWKTKLREAIGYSNDLINDLDQNYTDFLAGIISQFIEKHKIDDLDAICSHGHTIRHQPNKGLTIQIGNLEKLATLTENKVVCDFRVQDVQMGGQGAPLVPIGDRFLFNKYDSCLNLGGFANVSCEKNGKRLAFDVCPVNIVLNHYAEKLDHAFDDRGKLAASGAIDSQLLVELNSLDYYKQSPPKSLGLEWVQSTILPLTEKSRAPIKDILHTFTEHIAMQLSFHLEENKTVIITGGGVYNTYLMERLEHLSNVDLIIPSKELIEYKEALIFGFLGVLKLRGENNCLASVTGAKKDHSSGNIFKP